MTYAKAADLISAQGHGTAEVQLPVGFAPSHDSLTRNRSAVVSEMTGFMEEHVFEVRKKGKAAMAGIITSILQIGLNRIEGKEVWERKAPTDLAPEGLVRGMFQMDRETLFLGIMIATYPDSHEMILQCPECTEKFQLPVDLKETEVTPWPEDRPAYVDIVLPEALSIEIPPESAGDDTMAECRRARFFFPTGTDAEMASRAHGENASRVASFIYSRCLRPIAEGSGDIVTMTMAEAQAMPTRVRKGISKAIREDYPGPVLEAHVGCPECGKDVEAALNLSDFFSGE